MTTPSIRSLRCPALAPAEARRLRTERRRWNGFYRWLVSRRYHRLDFGNTPSFRRAVGDEIRQRLQRVAGRNRRAALGLATRLLGLRARTVRGDGSRWDCTTRMFQLTAQARRLASVPHIAYSGWRQGRVQTVTGRAVYGPNGYHVARRAITLMAVAHYRDPRLVKRNMAWKTPLLAAGALNDARWYGRLAPGDVLFYPDFGPGHFGVVLLRDPRFLVVLEGYWKGQPTVVHLYRRRTDLDLRCISRALARWRGFDQLLREVSHRVVPARNVLPGTLQEKGPLRVGVHR